MLHKDDELHILRLPKIMNTFSKDEFLQISMKLRKINEHGSSHSRNFILTNKRILLLDKLSVRRKIPLQFLIAITISSKSFEIILHFKEDYNDDDLRLQTENRSRLIEFIVKSYCSEFQKPLASFQVEDLNLKKFVYYKQDRKKNISKLPTVQVNYLNYQPILKEQQRKNELNKIYSNNQEAKQLFGNFLLQLSDFELIKILQDGAISQIVLIKNIKTNTQHAMKCIDKTLINLNEFIKFEQYAYHPFIVPLTYCFENSEKYFFIMPLAKTDCQKKLEEIEKLNTVQIKFCASQILLAIEHIHQKGLTHGDLKLENILIMEDGNLSLCDFGYWRIQKETIINGNPEYIPPETILNHTYNYYSDFWQFGILLYEMKFGHPPFIDYEKDITFDYILHCNVEFPIQNECEQSLKDLILQLLEKNPQKRIGYQMGISEIQAHPYFTNVNWKEVYDKVIQPPKFDRKLKLF